VSVEEKIDAIVSDVRLDGRVSSLLELMERLRVPGMSAAVVADGRLEWAQGWGLREAGRPDRVAVETLFQAGSISKPVAALCALKLVADEQLDLEADVNDVLTSWNVPASGGWQPRVTLRQLLSHTAGLTVHGFPGYARDERTPTLVEVLDGNGNTPPVLVSTMPGLQFSYSGGGYCVLQQLLIDLTGMPFPQLARELVLEPLGMQDSTYEQPLPEQRWAQAASGHRTGGKPVAGGWHVYPEMAAAGLWTTPSDLARFVIAIQRARSGAADAILPQGLATEMLRSQALNKAIGLGVFIEGRGNALRFTHSGDDQGFIAELVGYVDNGLGAVVMASSDRGWMLIQSLLEAIGRVFEWPEYPPVEPEVVDVAEVDLEACVGVYELPKGRSLTVERRSDRLALTAPGQAAVELCPASAGEWFVPALKMTVTFVREGASVRLAVIHQDADYVEDIAAQRAE